VEHFIPVVRSFAPVTAGAGKMNRGLFILCNTIGDIVWAVGFTLFGYFVGSKIPHIDKYIDPAIILVILIFTVPALIRIFGDPKVRTAIRSKLKRSKDSHSEK